MRRPWARCLTLSLVLAWATACGDNVLVAEGKACFTSAQCQPGLLCDTSKKPAVCAAAGSVRLDLSAATDALPSPDAGGDDASP